MKKIIFVLVLGLTVIYISARKQSSQNVPAEKLTKSVKIENSMSNTDKHNISPQILFILNKDTRLSPALWWSYDHSSKNGC